MARHSVQPVHARHVAVEDHDGREFALQFASAAAPLVAVVTSKPAAVTSSRMRSDHDLVVVDQQHARRDARRSAGWICVMTDSSAVMPLDGLRCLHDAAGQRQRGACLAQLHAQ